MRCQDGRGSIRKALGFLAQCADPEKEWPYKQTSPPTRYRRALPILLRRGADIYGEERYGELVEKPLKQEAGAHRLQLLCLKDRWGRE